MFTNKSYHIELAQNRHFINICKKKKLNEYKIEPKAKQKANTGYNGDMLANTKSHSLPYIIIIIIIVVETKQMDARWLG